MPDIRRGNADFTSHEPPRAGEFHTLGSGRGKQSSADAKDRGDAPGTADSKKGSSATSARPSTGGTPVARSVSSRSMAAAVIVAAVIVLAIAPLYVDATWLQLGFTVCATGVGAIGLKLLTGTAGQLSLGHAFFLAVGAISYSVLSSPSSTPGSPGLVGLGWPPLLGAAGAVAVSGVAGLLFAPVSSRLRGLYLGVATVGLVFLGQYLLNTATPLTGGYNGRSTPDFSLFGFTFSDAPLLTVAGVDFGRAEKLWYLGIVVLVAAALMARRLDVTRTGRALRMVRDSEIAAAVMGVPVRAYKARAFALSSMFAGAAGVLYALSIGSIAPDSFDINLSIQFLAMVVIGGMRSVVGTIIGAAFVTTLPVVLQQYSSSIPGLAGADSSMPGYVAQYAYGAAIILILVFQPAGLAGVATSVRDRLGRRRKGSTQSLAN